jgi:hypothetical protein
MKKRVLMICTGMFAFSLGSSRAVAGEEVSPETVVGEQTRSVLELQRSGQVASDTPRPSSGEVARRTHQRYVESFSQPVPESFAEQEKEFVREGD